MRSTVNRHALPCLLGLLALLLPLAPLSATVSHEELGVAPGRTIDLDFPEPTSAQEVYRTLGARFGVGVAFAPGLHDREIRLEAEEVSLAEALQLVTASSGHFATVLHEGALLVADDTPKNRRRYQQQAIRRLTLTNIHPKDVLTVLRSTLEVKKIATTGEHTIVVRDSLDVVELAVRLLERIDQPQGEVAIGTEVLVVDREALDELLAEQRADPGAPALSADELEAFRRSADARTLARPTLHLLEGERASLALRDTGPAGLGTNLYLRLRARLHPGSDEVTVDVDLETRSASETAGEEGDGAANHDRQLGSNFRVAEGTTYLFLDWLAPTAGEDRVPVFALTPRIVRAPEAGGGPDDLLRVGTDSHPEAVE